MWGVEFGKNMNKPLLSIVVPTRGPVEDFWFSQLLKVRGDADIILVYPPGAQPREVQDGRVRQFVAPLRGEVIQRLSGLFNAQGEYVLSFNCDECVHPDIAHLVQGYFKRFPESWALRLKWDRDIEFKGELDWRDMPDINRMEVLRKGDDLRAYSEGRAIIEVPIAPLDKWFNPLLLIQFYPRKDHHGLHMENFDHRVWRNSLVQEAIRELKDCFNMAGPFKWMPFWALDTLLGLFIQAKFFKKGIVIGHWLPAPAQVVDIDFRHKRGFRLYLLANMLALRKYARYGYLWNWVVAGFWEEARIHLGAFKRRIKRIV